MTIMKNIRQGGRRNISNNMEATRYQASGDRFISNIENDFHGRQLIAYKLIRHIKNKCNNGLAIEGTLCGICTGNRTLLKNNPAFDISATYPLKDLDVHQSRSIFYFLILFLISFVL